MGIAAGDIDGDLDFDIAVSNADVGVYYENHGGTLAQIFPFTLNLDDPRFKAGLDRLVRINAAQADARRRGGIVGTIRRVGLSIAAAATFGRLYTLPVVRHERRDNVRLAPTW